MTLSRRSAPERARRIARFFEDAQVDAEGGVGRLRSATTGTRSPARRD